MIWDWSNRSFPGHQNVHKCWINVFLFIMFETYFWLFYFRFIIITWMNYKLMEPKSSYHILSSIFEQRKKGAVTALVNSLRILPPNDLLCYRKPLSFTSASSSIWHPAFPYSAAESLIHAFHFQSHGLLELPPHLRQCFIFIICRQFSIHLLTKVSLVWSAVTTRLFWAVSFFL